MFQIKILSLIPTHCIPLVASPELSPVMGRFHDVSIYWGTRLLTTSTRLEVAARSPYLHQLLTSITVCDGCKEPTALIFPEEDETQNTLKEVFKSLSVRTGQARYSIVESKIFQ